MSASSVVQAVFAVRSATAIASALSIVFNCFTLDILLVIDYVHITATTSTRCQQPGFVSDCHDVHDWPFVVSLYHNFLQIYQHSPLLLK